MILRVDVPQINPNMTTAIVEAIHQTEGSLLVPGSKLFDLKIDLSLAVSHDCPPVSHHRLALRDRVWLRRALTSLGEELPVGAPLALFSSEPDESLDVVPSRAVRMSIVEILHQSYF